MQRSAYTLPVVLLSGALFLTACGTQRTGGEAGGPAGTSGVGASGTGASGAGACGAGGSGASSAPPAGDPSRLSADGVTITGFDAAQECLAYEIANSSDETRTYTVTFSVGTESGGALSNPEETVPSVAPGSTVHRTLPLGGMQQADASARARILTVRSVRTDEAPSEGGACPPSGVRVYADQGDAAMGLRVVGLNLENCGTDEYRLNGYPDLELANADHEPVDGIDILHGGSEISTGTGADGPPQPVTLKRGERAHATLVWRNTTEFGEAVNVPYVTVRAKSGADPVTVTPELDLGTTGRLGVGPWKKSEPLEGARP
ncbi:DUF4232 domain-containing protein [Streptomyces sp. NPDC088387]|uniref:DUF4232 domain-containing protein n=1 Tax=Streptomyces sp. NPDC088387 TaxID=3365859 RepID=UPI0037FC8345